MQYKEEDVEGLSITDFEKFLRLLKIVSETII